MESGRASDTARYIYYLEIWKHVTFRLHHGFESGWQVKGRIDSCQRLVTPVDRYWLKRWHENHTPSHPDCLNY
jgi:hypothetical protein